MKRLLLLLLVGFIFFTTGISSVRAETITLVADGWCPYNCEPNAEKPGYMVEIAKKAFEKYGIEIEYSNLPWARQNKYTGIIGAYYGDAPDFIFPSVAQGLSVFSFYVNKSDEWTYAGIDSLASRSLGAINDYSYSVHLDSYIESHKNDPTHIQILSGDNAIDNNIKKLLAKRIDTIVEDRQAMAYYLSPKEFESVRASIKEAGILPSEEDGNGVVFIAFSPNNPNSKRYAEILSSETIAMSKSGVLKEILSRYGIDDFTNEILK
jgi:polar amino acid transport system substrate-binding protein